MHYSQPRVTSDGALTQGRVPNCRPVPLRRTGSMCLSGGAHFIPQLNLSYGQIWLYSPPMGSGSQLPHSCTHQLSPHGWDKSCACKEARPGICLWGEALKDFVRVGVCATIACFPVPSHVLPQLVCVFTFAYQYKKHFYIHLPYGCKLLLSTVSSPFITDANILSLNSAFPAP